MREKVIPSELRVKRAPLIEAEITVPGDKSISHRAVMFASLSNGVCVLSDFSPGADCWSSVEAMRSLGVQIDQPESEPTTLVVHGRYRQLSAPPKPIDCGNSGTTMRLLAGLLAGQPFRSRLVGDASLSGRPMKRIMTPLEEMGARITAEGENGCAPLVIQGGPLRAIDYVLPMASAQVKSAVLLAGLYASGETSVTEPGQSRDHTERMLRYFLVNLDEKQDEAEGEPKRLVIKGGQMPESRNFTVPGDISSAAFWLAAAAAQPGARLLVKKIGLNGTRTGILSVLLRMGAHVHGSRRGHRAGRTHGHRRGAGRAAARHVHRGPRDSQRHRRNPDPRRARRAGERADRHPQTRRNCASRKPTGCAPSRRTSRRWARRWKNTRTGW